MKKIFAVLISVLMAAAMILPAAAVDSKDIFEYADVPGAVCYRSLTDLYTHMKAVRDGADFEGDEDVKNFLMTADKVYFPRRCMEICDDITSVTVAPTYVELKIEIDGVEISMYQCTSEEVGKREFLKLREQWENGEEGCEEALWQGGEVAETLARTTPVDGGFETCYCWHQSDGEDDIYLAMKLPFDFDPTWYHGGFFEAEPCRLFAKERIATCPVGEPNDGITYVGEDGESFEGWLWFPEGSKYYDSKKPGVKYIKENGVPMTGADMIRNDTVLRFDDEGFLLGTYTGWYIEGAKQIMYVNGKPARNIWVCKNGMRKYYADESGEMATGRQVIDGVEYDFGADGVLIDPWGLRMGVQNVTKTGCTVVFEQSGGENINELETGRGLTIERFDGKKWRKIEENEIAITAEAICINLNGRTTLDMSWKGLYGELEAGSYRLIKSVDNWRAPGDFDMREYCAYFEVEGEKI